MEASDIDENQMEQGTCVQTLDKNTPTENLQSSPLRARENRQKLKRGRPVSLSIEDFQKYIRSIDLFWSPPSNVELGRRLNVSEATIRRLRRKLNL